MGIARRMYVRFHLFFDPFGPSTVPPEDTTGFLLTDLRLPFSTLPKRRKCVADSHQAIMIERLD